jgi:transcriptional regulator with XRE-family HTH domain
MGNKPRHRPQRLAAKLLHMRKSLGVSQSQLLRLLELDLELETSRISEYEHGVREPSLITLLAYSYLVSIPINDFVDDTVELPSKIIIKRRRKHVTLV